MKKNNELLYLSLNGLSYFIVIVELFSLISSSYHYLNSDHNTGDFIRYIFLSFTKLAYPLFYFCLAQVLLRMWKSKENLL